MLALPTQPALLCATCTVISPIESALLLCAGAALQGSRSAHKTLRAWQKDVQVKANYWEKCRLQRVAEYEDLQVCSNHQRFTMAALLCANIYRTGSAFDSLHVQ